MIVSAFEETLFEGSFHFYQTRDLEVNEMLPQLEEANNNDVVDEEEHEVVTEELEEDDNMDEDVDDVIEWLLTKY